MHYFISALTERLLYVYLKEQVELEEMNIKENVNFILSVFASRKHS